MTETGAVMMTEAVWRDDLDALQFAVPGHGGVCLVHRLAFRALVTMPSTHDVGPFTNHVGGCAAHELSGELDRGTCLALFARETLAFQAAAIAKIARQSIPPGKNLHLNSRDIRRAMQGDDGGAKGRACRVLGG